MTSKWYVFRHGSNMANQPMTNVAQVARVDAESAEQACELAGRRVTVYANQQLTARPAEDVEAEERAIDRAVEVL